MSQSPIPNVPVNYSHGVRFSDVSGRALTKKITNPLTASRFKDAFAGAIGKSRADAASEKPFDDSSLRIFCYLFSRATSSSRLHGEMERR